ncbi:hypothetical protein IB234_10170 [Pseudomonas sp. PDM16]|uniref:DUF7832 domain-containing protein n=1 Tax=Pseudomonas sp. PDM16 TaxID=2769292 RepID=UPI001781CB47|nr:hypothetical protein [Pseudomonas sp. PDM16]MBD9414924.1 hypothetical protein [Pseudomonas sp. PDM16]
MAYDRIDWHSGGEYPAGLPEENGGIHIGMFLAWAFGQGMTGDVHREDSTDLLTALERREITGLDFLLQACDSKFWDEDLSEDGNAFAVDYYTSGDDSPFAAQHGNYLGDYCDLFNRHAEAHGFEYESTYHVENTWENFERVRVMLDQRLAQWRLWRADDANRLLDPKTQFLHACVEAGGVLGQQGFKPNKHGTLWKKTAADRDTLFEVDFEAERYNARANVQMTVNVRISSKRLKKWLSEFTGNKHCDGYVLFGSLRRPEKAIRVIVWQVSGASLTQSVREMREALAQYVLPLFDLFGDRERALEHLAAHGAGFTGVCQPEATPMAFMLCFGGQEQAQRFFELYYASRPGPWRGNIAKTFTRLQGGEEIAWNMSAYSDEHCIKLAFARGLVLPARKGEG